MTDTATVEYRVWQGDWQSGRLRGVGRQRDCGIRGSWSWRTGDFPLLASAPHAFGCRLWFTAVGSAIFSTHPLRDSVAKMEGVAWRRRVVPDHPVTALGRRGEQACPNISLQVRRTRLAARSQQTTDRKVEIDGWEVVH